MSLRTIQYPSIIQATKELDIRLRKLESYFTGVPIPSARIKRIILGGFNNEAGELFLRSDLNEDAITLNKDGIKLKALTDSLTTYMRYYDSSNRLISYSQFRSYTNDGNDITEFRSVTASKSGSNTITFNSLQINDSNHSKDIALQLDRVAVSDSFSSATLNFIKEGALSAFSVRIDNTNGTGFMRMIRRASDPSTESARFYYNTTTNKLRICENATWRDVITTLPTGLNIILTVETPYGNMNMTFTNGLLTAFAYV